MGLDYLGSVSFIIPVYNCAELIGKTMESIYEQQGKPDFEVIIVNDGSDDDSLLVCQKLAEQYENILVLSQHNAGPSAARNLGLKHAKGQYIVFVDADDIPEPDMLATLLSLMTDGAGLGVASYYIDFIDGDSRLTERVWTEQQIYKVKDQAFGFPCCEWYSKHILTPLWNKIYRRDIIEKYHLRFDEKVSISEDLLWNIQYLRHIELISATDQYVYHYLIRKHRETVTHRFQKEHVDMQIQVAVQMLDFLQYLKYQGKEIYYLSLKYITSSLCNIFYDKELSRNDRRTFVCRVMDEPTVEMFAANAVKTGLFSGVLIQSYRQKNIFPLQCILKVLYIFRRYFHGLQRKLMKLIRS